MVDVRNDMPGVDALAYMDDLTVMANTGAHLAEAIATASRMFEERRLSPGDDIVSALWRDVSSAAHLTDHLRGQYGVNRVHWRVSRAEGCRRCGNTKRLVDADDRKDMLKRLVSNAFRRIKPYAATRTCKRTDFAVKNMRGLTLQRAWYHLTGSEQPVGSAAVRLAPSGSRGGVHVVLFLV